MYILAVCSSWVSRELSHYFNESDNALCEREVRQCEGFLGVAKDSCTKGGGTREVRELKLS